MVIKSLVLVLRIYEPMTFLKINLRMLKIGLVEVF